MKTLKLLAVSALLAVAACDAPQNGLTIPQEAIDTFGDTPQADIIPLVSSKTYLAAFQSVCERNVEDFSKALAAIRADGYVQLVKSAEVTAYAHPAGKPVVAFGGPNPRNPELCMIMSRRSSGLRAAAEGYAQKLPNVLEIPIAGLADGAEKAWIPGNGAETLYLTVNQKDPNLGEVYAFAIGKL